MASEWDAFPKAQQSGASEWDAFPRSTAPAQPVESAWYERMANGLAQQGRAIRNTFSAIAEPAATIASGMVAMPTAAATGLAAEAYSGITGGPKIANDVMSDVMRAMTYQPRTEAGQAGLGVVSNAIDASKMAGAVGLMNEIPAIARAAKSDLPMMRARVTPSGAAQEAAAMAARNNPNMIDAAATARRHGLVLNPAVVRPSVGNQVGELLVGPSDMAHGAQRINAPLVEAVARQDIGIPNGVRLSDAAYSAVRREAAKPYDEIRKIKSFVPDEQFRQDLATMSDFSDHSPAVQSFLKQAEPALVAEMRGMAEKGFNGNDVVTLMRKFRKEANHILNSPVQRGVEEVALAEAKRSAAKAIESLVDRNLAAAEAVSPGQGFGDLAGRFREGRKTIAKSHTWQKFTDEQTGRVDALGLATMSSKPTNFTGGLADIAQVAANYPEAFTPKSALGPGLSLTLGGRLNSALDFFTAPVKKGMLSQGYQNRNVVGLDPRPLREQMGYGYAVPDAPAVSREPLKLGDLMQ